MINRRSLMGGVAIGGVVAAIGAAVGFRRPALAAGATFEVTKSDAEWHKILTHDQYYVLRDHGTEARRTSPLDHEKRKGTYACAGCDLPVYSSDAKFDSGTGWPSFWKPLPNAIGTSQDDTLFESRTEVHCRRCGGHLGHVFEDGPPPTGLRYCINGVAMTFTPAPAA